jgi:hypothetical protein
VRFLLAGGWVRFTRGGARLGKVWTEFSPRGDGRLLCIFGSVRRRVTLTSLVVAAVGVIAALAVADALRSRRSTPAMRR